jgi:molybdopterin converting factor small subunit
MRIRIVISGRSYDRAATAPDELDLAEGANLDDALAALQDLLGKDGRLSGSCLVAVSGRHVGTLANHVPQTLCDGDELVLFAPVAGG